VDEFFVSGRIVDLLLAIVALEAALVIAFRRRLAQTFDLSGFFINLASGVCLMLALRGALVDAGWMAIAPFLLLSLFAHVADLWRRRHPPARSK
jgi:hypothetical protein